LFEVNNYLIIFSACNKLLLQLRYVAVIAETHLLLRRTRVIPIFRSVLQSQIL